MLSPHASVPQHDSNVRTQIVLNSGTPRRRQGEPRLQPLVRARKQASKSRGSAFARVDPATASHPQLIITLKPGDPALPANARTISEEARSLLALLALLAGKGGVVRTARQESWKLAHAVTPLADTSKLGPFPSSRSVTWFFWTGKSWLLVYPIDEMAFRSGRSLRLLDKIVCRLSLENHSCFLLICSNCPHVLTEIFR